MNTLAYVFHIGGGSIGLASGLVSAFSPKGGYLHRKAGIVFAISMMVMACFAIYLAIVLPGQFVNAIIGTFVVYLMATAWMTVRRGERMAGVFDKMALMVALGLCMPFAILSFQLMTGMKPWITSAVPLHGPILIAIYTFTAVFVFAAIGDARVVVGGPLSSVPRLARHLWRMCLGLTLAAGSFFTNALPRLLPPPVHVTTAFFVPQLLVLCFLLYWMIRVRFPGWRQAQQTVQRRSGAQALSNP